MSLKPNAVPIIAFFFTLCSTSSLTAQDVIVLLNTDEIQAKVLEIAPTEITYHLYSNPLSAKKTIPASQVFLIIFENGTREIITPLDGKEEAKEPAPSKQLPKEEVNKTAPSPQTKPNKVATKPIVIFFSDGTKLNAANVDRSNSWITYTQFGDPAKAEYSVSQEQVSLIEYPDGEFYVPEAPVKNPDKTSKMSATEVAESPKNMASPAEPEENKLPVEKKSDTQVEVEKEIIRESDKSQSKSTDRLFLLSGEEIEAKVTEVSENEVSYKLIDNPEGPNYLVNKNKIFKIEYASGRREMYGSAETNNLKPEIAPQKQASKVANYTELDQARNVNESQLKDLIYIQNDAPIKAKVTKITDNYIEYFAIADGRMAKQSLNKNKSFYILYSDESRKALGIDKKYDQILLTSGNVVKAEIININGQRVLYKDMQAPGDYIEEVPLTNIKQIFYENGGRQIFNEPDTERKEKPQAYIRFNGGYSLPLWKELLFTTRQSEVSEQETNYGSFGNGVRLDGAFGIKLGRSGAIEAGYSYLLGKKITDRIDYKSDSLKLTGADTLYSRVHIIRASFLFHANLAYGGVGVAYGIPQITVDSFFDAEDITRREEYEYHSKSIYSGGGAIGISAIVGIDLPVSDHFGFFAQASAIVMSYTPKELRVATLEKNNNSMPKPPHTALKDTSSVFNSTPRHTLPLSSLGVDFGFKITF